MVRNHDEANPEPCGCNCGRKVFHKEIGLCEKNRNFGYLGSAFPCYYMFVK